MSSGKLQKALLHGHWRGAGGRPFPSTPQQRSAAAREHFARGAILHQRKLSWHKQALRERPHRLHAQQHAAVPTAQRPQCARACALGRSDL